jgi:hypothetical protein
MTDTENKLNFPTPIKVKPSISKYLDTLEEQGKTIWNFAGTDFIETLFYLHLLNKYKLYCFPSGKHLILPGNRPVGLFISLKQKYSKEEEDEFKQEFNAIADNIVNCVKRGEKMIMIPLCYKKLMSGHANILIYRVNENIIEHYEPHGGEFMSDKKAQDSIKQVLSFFTNILNNKLKVNNAGPVRYVEASQVCPYIQGMQSIEGSSRLPKKAIEPKGYCAAWSLFFIELNLKNPGLTSSEILDNVYNYLTTKASGPDYLKKVIRGYSGYIVEHVNKYLAVFFKPTYTVEKLLKKENMFKQIVLRHVFEVLIQLEIMIAMDPNFDLNTELKKTTKEYKKLTLGRTKDQQKVMKYKSNDLRNLYYKKRILQNYEEYKNLGRISEPIIEDDSPESINEAKIINPGILKKGFAHEEKTRQIDEYNNRPEVIESRKIQKKYLQSRKKITSPGSPKTRKNKYILPEELKQRIGDTEKVKALEILIKQQKIDIMTKEGQQKLAGILSMFGKK